MGVKKRAIGIVCDRKELFLSLKRALKRPFPGADLYFYDTNKIEKGQFRDIGSPGYKKAGVLIAFFKNDEENIRVCRFLKYLRVKRGLQFPLVFCSFSCKRELTDRYDLLTYGIGYEENRGSSLYCPIPIDFSYLIKLILNAVPLTDVLYRQFLEKYSGRYKGFYENSVLPLLNQLDNIATECDDSKWVKLTNELDKLRKQIIMTTPLTCHEKILYNGSSNSLCIHFENEMLELLKCKHSKKHTSGIRFFFQQWFESVSELTFE